MGAGEELNIIGCHWYQCFCLREIKRPGLVEYRVLTGIAKLLYFLLGQWIMKV